MSKIQFGALAAPIYEQLSCDPPEEESIAWHWERDHAAICRLWARGLLTERERYQVARRFLRRCERESDQAKTAPTRDQESPKKSRESP